MRRLWKRLPEGFRFAVGFIGIFVGIFVAIALAGNVLMAHSCRSQAEVLQVEADYGLWSGCNYLVDGVWIDHEQYGVVVLGERP